MKKILRTAGFLLMFPISVLAQDAAGVNGIQAKAALEPIEFGLRYDDNAFRSVDLGSRLSDEIYLVNGGAQFSSTYDVFKGELDYHLSADQYQLYSDLSNIKNNFGILLGAEPGEFSFYYQKEYFFRDSQYDQFNYWDDDNLLSVQWTPPGPWTYEVKGKYFSRQYYNIDSTIPAENFVDQGVLAGVGREIDERISVKLEGSYNDRQFNRSAIGDASGMFYVLPYIQTDETWSILLNAHLYFENILQDVNFEQQRTNSNSYGFSNTVQSVSWAAVVKPSASIYLQLLFRLFSKSYDNQPLVNKALQIGFIDEDSQDLLSLKATWDWAPQWSVSLSGSRFRNESIQPGEYYIEDLLTATVRRNF